MPSSRPAISGRFTHRCSCASRTSWARSSTLVYAWPIEPVRSDMFTWTGTSARSFSSRASGPCRFTSTSARPPVRRAATLRSPNVLPLRPARAIRRSASSEGASGRPCTRTFAEASPAGRSFGSSGRSRASASPLRSTLMSLGPSASSTPPAARRPPAIFSARSSTASFVPDSTAFAGFSSSAWKPANSALSLSRSACSS
ncbi:hypothetical protein [Nannocystis pusilla]|uniref:hypothetical protein n=1 Tax=Nannocystis pusilla TaxID=889268 RepID=UPI003DA3D7BF